SRVPRTATPKPAGGWRRRGTGECPAKGSFGLISAFCIHATMPSGAVIGMAGQNGRGPINLFQEHDANHLMRPGRRAERNAELSLAPQIGRKSVRAADRKNSIGDLVIPPAAKMPGKRRAVEVVAALVERHQDGFIGNGG